MVSVSLGRSEMAMGDLLQDRPIATLAVGAIAGVFGAVVTAIAAGGASGAIADALGLGDAFAFGLTSLLGFLLAWGGYMVATRTGGFTSASAGFAAGAALTWAALAAISSLATVTGAIGDVSAQGPTGRVAPLSTNQLVATAQLR